MAKIQSGDLSFDFRYTGFEYGWVQYQFYFRWKNESLANDDLLKKNGKYWGSRPDGAFLANEHKGDSLIPFLRKVLDNDHADYWSPLEPDIIIAIYPEDYFPFLPSHNKLIYESPDHKAEREERDALKKEKGKLPDDSYTLIVFVDAYNLKEADAYYGQGISLHMIVSRNELEEFVKDLEHEYQEFKQLFGVDQWYEKNA